MGTLPGIAYKRYYRQRHQDSSTIDVMVKEDDSLKLTRFQDSVCLKVASCVAEYDWEYLIEERNCELTASIGFFFYINLFLFVLISFIRFWFQVVGLGLGTTHLRPMVLAVLPPLTGATITRKAYRAPHASRGANIPHCSRSLFQIPVPSRIFTFLFFLFFISYSY
jgi:hypothetical protein